MNTSSYKKCALLAAILSTAPAGRTLVVNYTDTICSCPGLLLVTGHENCHLLIRQEPQAPAFRPLTTMAPLTNVVVTRSELTFLTIVYQAGQAKRNSEEGSDEKTCPTPCPRWQAYLSGFVMLSEATCLWGPQLHKNSLGDQPDAKKAKGR